MVAELDGGEFWLPAEFFNDDFNKEGNRPLAVEGELLTACIPRSSQPESATETESDEEDRNGELIRRLAHTFLYENSGFSAYKVPATETRMWPMLSREGPKHTAPMPSSPATSPSQMESELDFLYAAAWEVMRMRHMEHKFNGRRIHSRLQKPSSTAEIPFTRFMSFPSLTHQQLQAAFSFLPSYFFLFHIKIISCCYLYQLKRQQLIKQQLASAWNCNSRSAWSGRSSRNTAMASPPLSSQLPRTGMKAAQIDVRGNRRPSAGTGVFLPKREDIPSEALKKPASFTVPPARGLPTPKLNLDDTGWFQPPWPERYAVDYELVPKKCHQQQYDHLQIPAPPPPAVTSPDLLLPTEWTY